MHPSVSTLTHFTTAICLSDMEAAGGQDTSEVFGVQESTSGSPTSSPAYLDAQLQDAVHLKMEGNAFYREKNIRLAVGRYHRALLVLRGVDPDVSASVKGFGPEMPVLSHAQEELLRNTQVDCYNNLAACLLQRQNINYARVQEYSLRVLQWRPGDVKALYRAGVATLELGQAQMAKQYLSQACRGQPNDANVRKHLQKAEEKLNRELQQEKAMYRGMFSSSPKSNVGDGLNQGSMAGGGV